MSESEAPIAFDSLIATLADALGEVYLPLNPEADSPLNMVLPDTAHNALLKDIITRMYAENRARHLHSPVSLYPCLDAVGEIRGKLAREQADIEQIALVDRIGEILVSTLPEPLATSANTLA